MEKLPEVIVFLCKNCVTESHKLPRQWTCEGMHVRIKEIPCSGKTDAQYILHALESGVAGVCIVTCAQGKCTLAQGNYRAVIRVRTVQKLLIEIGGDPGRVELMHSAENETLATIKERINSTLKRFSNCAVVAH
jgi:coenzyme F420-reducing hydrogenase delta subunit